MRLSEISFPVYKLAPRLPSVVGSLVFYATRKKDSYKIEIIDDTSLEGSFGQRRTKLLYKALEGELKLFKINTAVYFLGDLIKLATPDMYFLDSAGKIFKYTKSRSVPLVYKKIVNITKVIGASLIEVEGINSRFMCLFPPMDNQKYAAIIKESLGSYILYGFSEEWQKDTVRKI